jgi:hypothetical protein|tara:strand:+ start:337 stop:480 length:144 start_codon:yes stop_codon:yes gene_type:complete
LIGNKLKKYLKTKLRRLEISLLNSPTFNVAVAVGLPVGLITLIGEMI